MVLVFAGLTRRFWCCRDMSGLEARTWRSRVKICHVILQQARPSFGGVAPQHHRPLLESKRNRASGSSEGCSVGGSVTFWQRQHICDGVRAEALFVFVLVFFVV